MRAYGILTNRRSDTGATIESITEHIKKGLNVMAVQHLGRCLGLSVNDVLGVIRMSPRAYARRRHSGASLGLLYSDRAYRIARVIVLAEEVFGSGDIAHDWLVSYNRALGAKPYELLDTEVGVERVRTVLGRIEFGVYS
ncbi:hypothetical protein B1C78_08990 [Thioalkalivibrio denitrificans]|uniref:Uncharacterized protein n=1 Tax=Thioalkalivibrio denitrificans TaxID=108003 RepID=A0A1V3NGW8_9GAMM|nr:antitoxin Xre/MbcA/ParS toxin-binding domain-containing protein [Thioalkalivibrio denitrificans]OOG24339.1 hypothetical protein B1C78_08990 [Thioalkalivibrio denitrificans]